MSEYTEDSSTKIDEQSRSRASSPVNYPPSSGYGSASPPPSPPNSPPPTSPAHTLKRSRTSSFRLINRRISVASNSSQLSLPSETKDRLAEAIGWYPAFLIRIYLELFALFFVVIFKRLPVILPTLWISGCVWMYSTSVSLVLSAAKEVLFVLLSPSSRRMGQKRTILISGGSSVQALHLARNFASAGARVIMCEIEGRSNLGRFSTSVHRCYTVPKPVDGLFDQYVDALKIVVSQEGAQYYIPVSETSAAYFDALAKPHLQALGCECICPELREVLLLDDVSEFMRKVQGEGLTTPNVYQVTSNSELSRLYDFGVVKKEKHFMLSSGVEGCKVRTKIELPNTRKLLKTLPIINEMNPWLVVQDCAGEKYVTCTTVKESQVVCNVTCVMDELGGLVPVEKPEIELWMRRFFASLKAHRKIVGHFSFYFTDEPERGLMPTDCQIGVRLPYICYTSVQSRMVWKPCRHFSRNMSGPIVVDGGKYWLHEVIKNTLEYPTVSRIAKFWPILWGKNDALLAWWDPLPYCAYYFVMLPANKISDWLSRLNSL